MINEVTFELRGVPPTEAEMLSGSVRNRVAKVWRGAITRRGRVTVDDDPMIAEFQRRRGYDPTVALQEESMDALGTLDAEHRSPAAASLQQTLCSTTFERDPKLDQYFSSPSPPFCTGIVPPSCTVYERDANDMDMNDGERRYAVLSHCLHGRLTSLSHSRTRTVPFHGLYQVLPLQRGPHVLRQENSLLPSPQAKRSFETMSHDQMATSQWAGVEVRKCDVDSTSMRRWQRALKHPGLPQLHDLFFRNTGVSVEEGRRTPLPYNFGPVLNRIYAQHADLMGDFADQSEHLVYPRDAMRSRVEQALAMMQGGGHMVDYEDLMSDEEEEEEGDAMDIELNY